MAHWVSSKPGLKELEEEGHKITAQAEKDLQKLLQRRKRLWKLVGSLSRKEERQ